MQLSSTLGKYLKEVQETFKLKNWKKEIGQPLYKQLSPDVNPSHSFQITNNDLNSSISQKVNNYTNQLKDYLMQKFDSSIKLQAEENQSIYAKLSTQSSKNVLNSGICKSQQYKRAKSAKNVKLKSESSTHQVSQIVNQMSNNHLTQKQNIYDHQMLTSLSKIVDNKHKKTSFQGNHSHCLQCAEFQTRLSKLESLVQTLLSEKTSKSIGLKTQSLQHLKEGKPVVRKRLVVSSEKKRILSLPSRDKEANSTNKKISTKAEIPESSTKVIEESRSKINVKLNKLNQKQTYVLKKSNLKLSKDYNPIIEYNMKSSKRVLFKSEKVQGLIQKSDNQRL